MTVEQVKKKLSRDLLRYDFVIGVGVRRERGRDYVVVYVKKGAKADTSLIPGSLGGTEVRVEERDEIVAF
jgi:hypothetical protein